MADQLPSPQQLSTNDTRQPAVGVDNTPGGANVNVISPEGQFVSVSSDQLNSALNQGYTQPAPKEEAKLVREAQYGTTTEQAKTFAEGLGQGIAGPLAPLAETALGVNPEDIRARKEVNPGVAATGEIAGLGAGLLAGTGEAAVAEAAGKAGIEALGLSAVDSGLAKVGSAAVKGAIENSIIQSGDEVSKMILQDPDQSAHTALIDIGLSGLIGAGASGALGTLSPLWDAKVGSKVGVFLDTLQQRAGGIDGMLPDEVNSAIQRAGMDIDPIVKSALSSDPKMRESFQLLQESSTESGKKAQRLLSDFKNKSAESLANAFGMSPEEITGIKMSDYDAGNDIKSALVDSLKATIDPISDSFEKIKNKYKNVPIDPLMKDDIANQIGHMASQEGYNLAPSSSQFKVIQRTLGEISNIKNLEDLRKYTSIINDTTSNPELWRVGGQLKTILRNVEEETVSNAADRLSSNALGEHQEARAAYKQAMTQLDSLNDRLHVGRYSGPGSFIKALKEMAPEDILRRLNPAKDAGLIEDLMRINPGMADMLRKHYVSEMFQKASAKSTGEELLNPKIVFNQLEKMSPEMRNFIMPGEISGHVNAIEALMNALPAKMNTSGTAKTLDALWNKVPGSAIGMATMLLGHGPAAGVAGYLLGHVGKLVSRDVPDAVRLAMLKFMGSAKPIDSGAFKSMVDFMHHVIKGETTLNKAAKAVFTSGREVLPGYMLPTDKSRAQLKKKIEALQQDPSPLLDMTGKTGHYMPEVSTALGQTAATATAYLQTLIPQENRANPLDSKAVPNSIQKSLYSNAISIADQPLIVLDKLKKGTITPNDINTLKAIYPQLYTKISSKLVDQVMQVSDKGNLIPYKTRVGLSLFLGQPMDSSFTPQSIMSSQPIPRQAPEQQQQSAPKSKTNALDKFGTTYATPEQSRAQARANHKG